MTGFCGGGDSDDDGLDEFRATIVDESQIFWYCDNLPVMRENLADESVDLIYLDPPFNSQRIYNQYMAEANGTLSEAQRRAFDDYWSWGAEAETAYSEILHPRRLKQHVPAALAGTLEALRGVLQKSNMMAYLAMMAVRLVEMRRVLKPTGSIYLHCDPTASHYLKLLLDASSARRPTRASSCWTRSAGAAPRSSRRSD